MHHTASRSLPQSDSFEEAANGRRAIVPGLVHTPTHNAKYTARFCCKGLYSVISEHLDGDKDKRYVGYGAGGEVSYAAGTPLKVMTTGHCINKLLDVIRKKHERQVKRTVARSHGRT